MNGNTFVVNAPANGEAKPYIGAMRVDGKDYTHNYITHRMLLDGAHIDVDMESTPNLKRGITDDDAPYSFSREKR